MVYHQHPYEDVSGILFKNMPDGLWGASLKIPKSNVSTGNFSLTRVTLELLTTLDQSGSTFYVQGSSYQGADNYFNHLQYPQGWSYKGTVIGTPFNVPAKDIVPSKQMSSLYFPSTRVNMWYAGLQGSYKRSLFTVRGSYSRNYGGPNYPFLPPRKQFSTMVTAQIPVSKWYNTNILARLSLDNGTLFTNSFGGYLGIKKSW